MNHLETIYAPDGEAFELLPERAADLVLNHGWTRTPTQANPLPPAEKKTSLGRRKRVSLVTRAYAE